MSVYPLRLATRLPKYISSMGLIAGLSYAVMKIREKIGLAPAEAVVRSKSLFHPLFVRTRPSSDTLVFEQVCVDREFDFLERLSGPVRFILDLGANIGCASAYFLSAFPEASVIAIEPDPGNAARCRENLRAYGNRIKVVEGAVWHSAGALAISHETGMEWAVQVRQADPGECADITAYSIPDLLRASPFQKIDLLKIDIEGSELALFSKNTEQWLGKVKNICIELHGKECELAFRSALEGYRYETGRVGEHLLCLNLSSFRA